MPTPEISAIERVAPQQEQPTTAAAPTARFPESASTAVSAPTVEAAPVLRPSKSPLREDIENALSEGLGDTYAALDPNTQTRFREQGERLANDLERAVALGAFDVRKIHDGILDWLKELPTRGQFFHYFLEQDAKARTDTILALTRNKT